jgi:ferrous iron transport protein B
VAVSALATVYALSGGDAAADQLGGLIAGQWSLATAMALLAWYVFAPQCVSTLATLRRESGGWRLPLGLAGAYFALAYAAAWLTYRLTLALLG